MKKLFKSMFMLTIAALAFTSCEDVPAPYDDPNNNVDPDEPGIVVEPTGDGTLANPFNVAAAVKYITDGGSEDAEMYVKGIVVSVDNGSYDPSYGSLKYYISDDGTTKDQFRVFNGYKGPNRTKFSGEDDLKPGDEVVICGKLVNYNGTKEFTTGNYTVSINGETPGNTPDVPDTPADGTYISETFSSSWGVFTPKTVKGTSWVLDSYGYAKATGYDNASKVTTPSEAYIVSNAVDMSTSKEAAVTFDYVLRYVTTSAGEPIDGIANKVLVTDNYTGDPATTTWADITGTLKEVRDWKTWTTFSAAVPSNIIGKSKVVFALYYACSASSGTWEVKNFAVKEGKDEGGDDNPGGDTGDTSASNGNFETWVDGKPNNWTTASSAGNATLSQSTDAHGGSYSVKVGGTSSANKRIGYKEMELKAGEYTMTFYAKAATATGAAVRPGYVAIKADGTADSANYKYGDYTNGLTNGEWVLVTHTFTIAADGTYCLVIMNSKNPGADVLIDDFKLVGNGATIIE